MCATGIIAEFNPFHNGHLKLMQTVKSENGNKPVVIVMSGNFVQRGEPAIIDKWARAQMALENGADLVIELPVYYATAGAAYFARGAASLLEATGIVNELFFGSECGEIEKINSAGNFFIDEPKNFSGSMKKYLSEGMSYPSARQKAAADFFCVADGIISQPNNTLGVEYIIALKKIGSNIIPKTVKRFDGSDISSAKFLRKIFAEDEINLHADKLPQNILKIIEKKYAAKSFAALDNLSAVFHYLLKTQTVSKLAAYLDIDEALARRFAECSGSRFFMSDIIFAVKTKRYTHTHLQRAALHVILNIETENMEMFEKSGGPQYIRVLGFKKESAFLFKLMQKKSTLPLLTNIKNANNVLPELAMKMFLKEIESTDIYFLAQKNGAGQKNYEYRTPLVII
ncbi:MAG: nucleotidyltransferase family protein [Defluviitaleaceae bacterium]|nr:nucleotidyltransferase family protein [Defluviitaleaceae bacterium]